jgi:hypothetical protein
MLMRRLAIVLALVAMRCAPAKPASRPPLLGPRPSMNCLQTAPLLACIHRTPDTDMDAFVAGMRACFRCE